jgi:transcriptional regulator with XRE-family HTH domain
VPSHGAPGDAGRGRPIGGKQQVSVAGYNLLVSDITIDLTRARLGPEIGRVVRDARRLVGWSQRDLAARVGASQAAIWRLETGQPGRIDLTLVEGVMEALGLRATIGIEGRHLDDRRRQRDGVHAVVNGFTARRLDRLGWATATEVQIGGQHPRGWIDLLAFRSEDRALVVEEAKTEIPDMGGLQRSLSFYAREARTVATGLGWPARSVTVLVLGLDSETMARRLADNRAIVEQAFPGSVPAMAAWLADPGAPAPRGWTLAVVDPTVRGEAWLRSPMLGSRRRPPAYRDYSDAASRLLRG